MRCACLIGSDEDCFFRRLGESSKGPGRPGRRRQQANEGFFQTLGENFLWISILQY